MYCIHSDRTMKCDVCCWLQCTCIHLAVVGGNPSVHIMYTSRQPPIAMNMTWYAHDMYMICTWHAHDVHDMHMMCSLLILTTRNLRDQAENKKLGNYLRQSKWFHDVREGQLLQATAVYTVMLHCFVCIKICAFAN